MVKRKNRRLFSYCMYFNFRMTHTQQNHTGFNYPLTL